MKPTFFLGTIGSCLLLACASEPIAESAAELHATTNPPSAGGYFHPPIPEITLNPQDSVNSHELATGNIVQSLFAPQLLGEWDYVRSHPAITGYGIFGGGAPSDGMRYTDKPKNLENHFNVHTLWPTNVPYIHDLPWAIQALEEHGQDFIIEHSGMSAGSCHQAAGHPSVAGLPLDQKRDHFARLSAMFHFGRNPAFAPQGAPLAEYFEDAANSGQTNIELVLRFDGMLARMFGGKHNEWNCVPHQTLDDAAPADEWICGCHSFGFDIPADATEYMRYLLVEMERWEAEWNETHATPVTANLELEWIINSANWAMHQPTESSAAMNDTVLVPGWKGSGFGYGTNGWGNFPMDGSQPLPEDGNPPVPLDWAISLMLAWLNNPTTNPPEWGVDIRAIHTDPGYNLLNGYDPAGYPHKLVDDFGPKVFFYREATIRHLVESYNVNGHHRTYGKLIGGFYSPWPEETCPSTSYLQHVNDGCATAGNEKALDGTLAMVELLAHGFYNFELPETLDPGAPMVEFRDNPNPAVTIHSYGNAPTEFLPEDPSDPEAASYPFMYIARRVLEAYETMLLPVE